MADIAILVAEEYERRTKGLKKRSANKIEGQDQESSINLASGVAVLAKRIDVLSWVKKIEEEKVEFAKRVLEPKSPFSALAIDGVFSA